jgi:hypothetical protein
VGEQGQEEVHPPVSVEIPGPGPDDPRVLGPERNAGSRRGIVERPITPVQQNLQSSDAVTLDEIAVRHPDGTAGGAEYEVEGAIAVQIRAGDPHGRALRADDLRRQRKPLHRPEVSPAVVQQEEILETPSRAEHEVRKTVGVHVDE